MYTRVHMHHKTVIHTLKIFERIYKDLPPLLPDEIRHDMGIAIEQVRHNFSLTIGELEDTMVMFAKRAWPYRQAFHEFIDVYEGKMGESLLLQKLTPELKKEYERFLAHGGSYRDLVVGGPTHFFSPEERVEIAVTLISIRKSIRDHVEQAVLSTERAAYEARVFEFHDILDELEKRLDTLRLMADNEQEHPELAAEIREQVKAFEYGLASLGPHTSFSAVMGSEEHFIGRKKDKVSLRVL
jgi:hypothetical protein